MSIIIDLGFTTMHQFQANIHIDHPLTDSALLEALMQSASQTIVLADTNTSGHCLPVLTQKFPVLKQAVIIEILPGEQHKIQTTLFYILEQLALHQADRKALLVNVGGGVVCDIGGFAAAIYKRGIQCVHIPTTLLAQIDAAIGGKNGIDFLGYKNMIGSIREPDLVYISRSFLNTLSKQEVNNGIAEAFKHGLIYDATYWSEIAENPHANIESLINTSIAIKSTIVQMDPDEKGMRKILNAGHTIGHALEAWKIDNYSPIPHGEAVAAGLIIEAHISMQMGYLPANVYEEIKKFISMHFGKIELEDDDFDVLLSKMQHDKKNEFNKISFSLIRSIGKATYNDFCDTSVILNALNAYKNGQ